MDNNVSMIKSYVWHGADCFFVSTIDRISGVAEAPDMRHSETIVWEFDWDKQEIGRIFGQVGTYQDSIKEHFAVCEYLFLHCLMPPDNEDD